MLKSIDNLDSSVAKVVAAKATTVNVLIKWVILIIIIQGIVACGGNGRVNNTATQNSYEILKAGTVPADIRKFQAQDLLAAREESSGTLKMAYEGAIARFTELNGRKPQDDLETAAAICDWVAFHLRHPHFYPENPLLPRFYKHLSPDPKLNIFSGDPAKIISYTLQFDPSDSENWPSPFCTHQSFAAAGIMNYAGLHARLCYVEGHDGLEYYSWKYKKWIWCEATFNEHIVLPLPDGSFKPLGVKELQELTLMNGLDKVRTIKHGYPDDKIPGYSYLGAHPHGFRRYAPFLYMQTLNGKGANLSSALMGTSVLPIPATYVANANEVVQLELDPTSVFSRLSMHANPLLLDIPLNALALGHYDASQLDGLVINLRTWLPYATLFEVQYGAGTTWRTIDLITTPIATGSTSTSISLPWNSGVVSFRAKDNVGNTSETLTILLKQSQ